MKKAVAAVGEAMEWAGVAEKGFAGGNALLGNTGLGGAATMLSSRASAPHAPGTSWSSRGGASNALIARVTQNLSSGFARAPEDLELALAEQGLSWGPPFPPGRPLDPFWGYRRPPRTWDYQVGENVHLTPRQGRISFQTLEDLWNGYDVAQICLVPDTQILTKRGLVAIRHVSVDDEVMTHKGRWRKVLKTMVNPSTGHRMYEMRSGGLDPLIATGDHPVLAARYTHTQTRKRVMQKLDWVNVDELRARGTDKAAPWRYDAATLPVVEHNVPGATLDIAAVIGEESANHQGSIKVKDGRIWRGHKGTHIPAKVPYSPALGRLFGWYLAEGCLSGGRSVTWTLGCGEHAYAEQILKDAKSVFGLDGTITPRDSALVVRVSSAPLARLFKCGTARTKSVPEWVWDGGREFLAAVLEGWVLGDGCRFQRNNDAPRVAVTTTSHTLAWQMRLIAISLGLKPSVVAHHHPGQTSTLRDGRKIHSGPVHYSVEWAESPKRTGRWSFEEEGHVLATAIQTVTEVEYDGLVYNLEVEEDQSYVTTAGTVHNCTQHLINDVRSLDYNWEPIPGIKADVSEDIEQAIAFFDSPDKQQPFRAWLAEYLEDVIKFDAGALYIRRNEVGDPIALEVVSGKTIIPLVDFYGRRPHDEEDDQADPEDLFDGSIVPAYLQINEGLPWDWLASDDLIYQPWNPQPASQYGRAPLERVLLSANTDIRFQWHFLQFFTEGSVPAGFMEAPPDMSDPAQVAHWQEVWDAVMVGDQGKQTQVRWVPNGSKFTGTKDDANRFDKDFPLYLMRRTCAAHGTTPSDLGFTEEVNKACYSEDTEVLTEHGWRFYDEVAPTDQIATLNPDTGALEYHVPDSLHVYPHEGEMVRFRAAGVDTLVTPDHKMWVRKRRTGTRLPLWEKVEARELEDASWFWFAGGAEWAHGPELDTFTLPEVESQSHRKPEREIPMDLWLEFLGYVVSEGCVHRPSDGAPRYHISLSQNMCVNLEKAAKIEACLARLPVAFKSTDRADGARVWQVGDKALWMWLSENVGHTSGSKHLPPTARGLSRRQAEILLDALMLGDGSVDGRPRCMGRSYSTTSSRLAGEVQEMAWKLGWRAQICGGTCLRVLMTPSKDFQLNWQNVSREHYDGVVWCFHVRNHLFVTRRNGKIAIHGNTGDTQIDVQFRVGTAPLLRHVEDVIGTFVKQHLRLRCRLRIDDGKETEDRVASATADRMDIEIGVMGVDERRMKLGLHVDKSRPMPRFVNNTRSGPVPLLAIESMAGEIDPETYGPSDAQKPVSTPFSPPPGVIPPTGSPEQLQAAEHTAQSARDLVKATVGEAMSTDPTAEHEETEKPAPARPAGEDESEEEEGGEEGGAEKGNVVKEYMPEFDGERVSFVGPDGETRTGYVQTIGPNGDVALSDTEAGEAETLIGWQELEAIDGPWEEYKPNCFRQVQKGADNTGGPGVTRGMTDPSLNAANPLVGEGKPTTIVGGTDGLTVTSGVENLLSDDDDDDEDGDDDVVKAEYLALALRRWRDNSRNRLKKGRAPRRFVDPNLPQGLHDEVWARLEVAKSREEVDAAFALAARPKVGAG